MQINHVGLQLASADLCWDQLTSSLRHAIQYGILNCQL